MQWNDRLLSINQFGGRNPIAPSAGNPASIIPQIDNNITTCRPGREAYRITTVLGLIALNCKCINTIWHTLN